MFVNELKEITKNVLMKELEERPLILKNLLMERMRGVAKEGYSRLDFQFIDKQEIIEKTIRLLVDEGISVDYKAMRATFRW